MCIRDRGGGARCVAVGVAKGCRAHPVERKMTCSGSFTVTFSAMRTQAMSPRLAWLIAAQVACSSGSAALCAPLSKDARLPACTPSGSAERSLSSALKTPLTTTIRMPGASPSTYSSSSAALGVSTAAIMCVASRAEKSVCRQASSLRPGSCAALAGPSADSRTAAIAPLSDGAAAMSSALFSHRSLIGSGVIVTASLAAAAPSSIWVLSLISRQLTADLGEDRARGCAGPPPLCMYEATDALTSASSVACRIQTAQSLMAVFGQDLRTCAGVLSAASAIVSAAFQVCRHDAAASATARRRAWH
eukprot:scaffold65974_cov66-Phaeocystis_antarctica.AAC.1